jgi:hypothetical protein
VQDGFGGGLSVQLRQIEYCLALLVSDELMFCAYTYHLMLT